MRFEWVVLAFCFALGSQLGGCSSGQTASADCVGPVSCVCDPLYSGGTLLRVHVERVDAGKLEAVVDEVFSPPENAHAAEVGDRVGGAVLAEQPCASDAASSLQVGSELLVLYSAGVTRDYPNCSAFQDCAAAQCASLAEPALSDCWSACDDTTNEFCTEQRSVALLDGVFSWAIPWADTLSFGSSHELAGSEISVLFSHESCVERFPAPPAPPCNDVNVGHCSATPRPSVHGVGSLSLLLGVVLARRVRRAKALARRRAPSSGRACAFGKPRPGLAHGLTPPDVLSASSTPSPFARAPGEAQRQNDSSGKQSEHARPRAYEPGSSADVKPWSPRR